MITFRLPWWAFCAGLGVVIAASTIGARQSIESALYLWGVLLLLDGCLGTRILPGLTPHASYPADWRAIEKNLYCRKQGMARMAVSVALAGALCIGVELAGQSDLTNWYSLGAIVGWCGLWLVAALSAIRDALAND